MQDDLERDTNFTAPVANVLHEAAEAARTTSNYVMQRLAGEPRVTITHTHTYIHTYIHAMSHLWKAHIYVIHTYIYVYIHSYMYTYIYGYIHIWIFSY